MTDKQFTQLVTAIKADIRHDTPKDTGNLRFNATDGRPVASGKYVITVSGRIAPYFGAVNNRARYPSGRPNPNYQYFEKSLMAHLEKYAKAAGGTVEHG